MICQQKLKNILATFDWLHGLYKLLVQVKFWRIEKPHFVNHSHWYGVMIPITITSRRWWLMKFLAEPIPDRITVNPLPGKSWNLVRSTVWGTVWRHIMPKIGLTASFLPGCPSLPAFPCTQNQWCSLSPLYAQPWVASMNLHYSSLMLGVHKQTSKAQTIESLTKPQALNNPSKYKVAIAQSKISRVMILNETTIMRSQNRLKSQWLEGHKMNAQTLNILKLPPWGSWGFSPGDCHSTWDPSRHHVSIVSEVKNSSSQVGISSAKWICKRLVRGSPPMTRLLPSSSQPLSSNGEPSRVFLALYNFWASMQKMSGTVCTINKT